MANDVTMVSGNTFVEVYANTARTATPNTQEFEFLGEVPMAALFCLSVTVGAALSLTFKVEAVDRTAGVAFPLLTGTAVTGVSTATYTLGASMPATANVSANTVFPSIMRVTITHGNATSCNYSLAMFLGSA